MPEPYECLDECLGPMPTFYRLVGERIRSLRGAARLRQADVAHRAGIHEMTLCRVEGGKASAIYAETIYRIAWALGVSADCILGIEETNHDALHRSAQREI